MEITVHIHSFSLPSIDKKDPELEEQTAKVSKLQKIPFEEAKQLYKKEQEAMFEQQKQKRKLMQDRGIAIDPFTFADNLLAFE